MISGWRGQYYKYRELSLNVLAANNGQSDVRAFLEIILSLFTLIVFTAFALKPTILTMLSLNQSIQERQSTLNNLNQKIKNLQIANNVFLQDQAVVPDIDTAISNNPQPDTISKQILGISSKDSVNIINMSLGPVTILGPSTIPGASTQSTSSTPSITPFPTGAGSLPFSITTTGDYSSLVMFIKDLENLRIPIKVDNMVLSSYQTGTTNVTSELISGRIPYLGQSN